MEEEGSSQRDNESLPEVKTYVTEPKAPVSERDCQEPWLSEEANAAAKYQTVKAIKSPPKKRDFPTTDLKEKCDNNEVLEAVKKEKFATVSAVCLSHAEDDKCREQKNFFTSTPSSEESLTPDDARMERPSKGQILAKFSRLLGNTGPTSYQKLRGRTESLYDIETGRDRRRAGRLFTPVLPINDRAKKGKKQVDVRTTGSMSVHVCCGMAEAGLCPVNTFDLDLVAGRDLDQSLLGVDDVISVDGSNLSDSSDDDLGSQCRAGFGSTDTDTDSKKEFGRTTVPTTTFDATTDFCNVQNEKVGQFPPLMVFYSQVRREFQGHRLYLNHSENVDFSIFEFGRRREYFYWRCACLTLVSVLHLCTYFVVEEGPDVCLHIWLMWLLLLQLSLEVVALAWQCWFYPTCYLTRVQATPLHWKVVWCLNNMVAPNLFSCCVMYACVFSDGAPLSGNLGANIHLVLVMVCFLNSSLGALPVRLAHAYHPLLLTLTFIVYCNLARPCSSYPEYLVGGWEESLRRRMQVPACYMEALMWGASGSCCIIFTLLWTALTLCAHCSLVLLCWCRRVVFRGRRKCSVPVYGQETSTFFFPEHGAEVSPQMVLMCEQDGYPANKFTSGFDLTPPYTACLRHRRGRATPDTGFSSLS